MVGSEGITLSVHVNHKSFTSLSHDFVLLKVASGIVGFQSILKFVNSLEVLHNSVHVAGVSKVGKTRRDDNFITSHHSLSSLGRSHVL